MKKNLPAITHVTRTVPSDAIAATCDELAASGHFFLTTTATGCVVSIDDPRWTYVLVFSRCFAAPSLPRGRAA